MYSFLFDPAYMTLIALALLIFLVMFLWRKVTIIEGNFFILEKRVNLMKKESRETSLAKNLERTNIVMNEIFNDAIPADMCKSVGSCPFPLKQDTNDMPSIKIVSAVASTGATDNTQEASDKDVDVLDMDDGIKISFTNNDDIDKKIEEAISADDIINAIGKDTGLENVHEDTASIASEFTLHDDKFSQKKLAKMNMDKLKDLCTQLNINSEGTKAQIISRILESNK